MNARFLSFDSEKYRQKYRHFQKCLGLRGPLLDFVVGRCWRSVELVGHQFKGAMLKPLGQQMLRTVVPACNQCQRPGKTADSRASPSPRVPVPRQGPYLHLLASSRDSRTCSLTILVSSRSSARCPPCQALRDAVALPSGVRGPVLCFHGCHCRISSACRCLRSNVQGVAMLVLQ